MMLRLMILTASKRLKHHDIKFIVASGTQYPLLASKFPRDYPELTFIFEHRARMISKEEDLVQFFQSHEEIEELVNPMESKHLDDIVCLMGEDQFGLLFWRFKGKRGAELWSRHCANPSKAS